MFAYRGTSPKKRKPKHVGFKNLEFGRKVSMWNANMLCSSTVDQEAWPWQW